MYLRHVKWSCGDNSGLTGVMFAEEQVKISQLSGRALPAELLLPVLHEVNTHTGDTKWAHDLLCEYHNRLQDTRARLERRKSKYGAINYIVKELANDMWLDIPTKAFVHVSCAGKLNGGVSMPELYLPPLLEAIVQDFPTPPAETWDMSVVEPKAWDRSAELPKELGSFIALIHSTFPGYAFGR